MQALVVYESMYGNTHVVAGRIGDGLRGAGLDVQVVPVGDATDELVRSAGVLVVGGPTHAHGLTSKMSRQAAVDAAEKDDELELDADAGGPGLRGWLHGIDPGGASTAAAFDTRIDASPALTGRASKGIARRLRHHGLEIVVESESFLVDKENHLLPGEAERATDWGQAVGEAAGAAAPRTSR